MKIESKYELNEEVYALQNSKVELFVIESINFPSVHYRHNLELKVHDIVYGLKGKTLYLAKEAEVFKTKEELITSL